MSAAHWPHELVVLGQSLRSAGGASLNLQQRDRERQRDEGNRQICRWGCFHSSKSEPKSIVLLHRLLLIHFILDSHCNLVLPSSPTCAQMISCLQTTVWGLRTWSWYKCPHKHWCTDVCVPVQCTVPPPGQRWRCPLSLLSDDWPSHPNHSPEPVYTWETEIKRRENRFRFKKHLESVNAGTGLGPSFSFR